MNTVPIWITLVIAGASGLASAVLTAILSPLIVSGLQQKNWRKQKLTEMRFEAFLGAISAINMYAADALDTRLQSDKQSYEGKVRAVEMRPETSAAMSNAQSLVSSFFTDGVYQLYDQAMKSEISIASAPNVLFDRARQRAIFEMAKELGIRPE